jgi:subtilisin family serine protease
LDFVQKSNYTIPAGSHGTMVAGIIAANTDNMIGIA